MKTNIELEARIAALKFINLMHRMGVQMCPDVVEDFHLMCEREADFLNYPPGYAEEYERTLRRFIIDEYDQAKA